MKRSTCFAILIFILVCISALYSREIQGQVKIKYPDLARQFKNLVDGHVKAAVIDTIEFSRDEAAFVLTGGTLYQCPPIGEDTHALLYIGNGTFKLTPPDEAEQMQLQRFYEKKSLNEKMEFLFLLFNDSTFNEIGSDLEFTDVEKKSDYRSYINKALKFLFDNEGNYLKENFVYPFLENKGNFFYSHFNDNNSDAMFYTNDPTEEENILLMRRSKQNFRNEFEVICQYASKELNKIQGEKNGSINISRYNIESEIKSNLDYSAAASLIFTPSFDQQKVIHLYLYSELEVDSITSENKEPVEFYKEEDSHTLWVLPAEPLRKDQNYAFNIYYNGDLLERNDFGWIYLKSSINWYPNTFKREKSFFDLIFHIPSKFKFCSIGELVSEEEDDDIITTRWQSKSPVRNASFNVGYYEEYKIEMENLPIVKVLYSESGHNEIAHSFGKEGILSKSDMEEKLAADVVNSFNLFKQVYGDLPLKEIYVTEAPQSHAEAFPGLVHIPWAAFQGIYDEGFVETLIAHEVAHQWWGHGVDFKSYRDQWLSEAFATYSGLWYMQIAKGNDIFFNMLNKWKESILNNRKYLFGQGQEAGPVWLGYRTNSSETEGDYNLIVYKKGAWILHMLRNMMLDLKTMKEDAFENMMRDFFGTFAGKYASTADFQKVVDKHFGKNMSWFFNQWVYNTYIPEYTFAYNTVKTENGKFKTRCRVKQENVPVDFQMPVNVLINFGDDKFVRLRVVVTGANSEFDLPLLPLEPKEIIFNDLHSVLSTVNYKKW